jgi:ubiquinone/menaquinone biosynthesis C-methylase UbiE
VGQTGLIFGLDIAANMLVRAAHRVQEATLNNVLLIRGDAHALPFADQALSKVNCSGGFHQIPNLPHALEELARVMADNARLSFSTFAEAPNDRQARLKQWLKDTAALHFVPLETLGEHLRHAGFTAYHWQLPGPWFGYATAQKAVSQI